MKPHLVTADEVAIWWPKVSDQLESAVDTGDGEMDVGQLRLLLTQANAHLIVLVNDDETVGASLAIELVDHPSMRIARIIAAGGRGLTKEMPAWDEIKAWLKRMGCSKVEALSNASRARLFERIGLITIYHVVRSDL